MTRSLLALAQSDDMPASRATTHRDDLPASLDALARSDDMPASLHALAKSDDMPASPHALAKSDDMRLRLTRSHGATDCQLRFPPGAQSDDVPASLTRRAE